MTAFGPYETEAAAAVEEMPRAVRNLPYDPANPGRNARDLQLSFIRQACADAGVELGRYDERMVIWLCNYEPAIVQVFIGLISRAAAGRQASGGELGTMRVIEHEGRGLKVITLALHDRICTARVASPQEGTNPEVLHCHFCGFCYPRQQPGGVTRG